MSCRQTTTTSTQSVTAQAHDGGSPSLSTPAPAPTFHLQPEAQTAVSTASFMCLCARTLISICVHMSISPYFPLCVIAFSCPAGKYLEMSIQECTPCAAGSYSLGSGLRFDQWDAIPAGFTSLASFFDPGPNGEDLQACNRWHRRSQTLPFPQVRQTMGLSTEVLNWVNTVFSCCCVMLFASSSWTPQGVYLESNRDECTVSLVYAVHLEKQGSVSFTYQYPDNNIFFEFYVSSSNRFLQYDVFWCIYHWVVLFLVI